MENPRRSLRQEMSEETEGDRRRSGTGHEGDRGQGTFQWFVVPALAGFGFENRSCSVFRLKAVLRTGADWPFAEGDRGDRGQSTSYAPTKIDAQ